MALKDTCCSKDKYELSYPSFSVVFIHTFMVDSDQDQWLIESAEMDADKYKKANDCIRSRIINDPEKQFTFRGAKVPFPVPVGYKAESTSIAEDVDDKDLVQMENLVEKLLFTKSSLEKNQIVRYSTRGFDFRIPVRSDVERDDDGNIIETDFEPVDFEGHANVEVSQFFGNIFSVTYRFLFDGNMCRVLEPDMGADQDDDNLDKLRQKERCRVEAVTNHLISFLATYLGAEYWTSDPLEVNKKGSIDLQCRMIIDNFWLNADGYAVTGANDKDPNPWVLTNEKGDVRAFDEVALRYKKFLIHQYDSKVKTDGVTVNEDSRYAMVDIWETVRHPYGTDLKKDLFSDKHCPQLGEAGIIDHIRDYHKPELVGLMTMYPAEWPYREAVAYDDVCGESIAIDVDDLVLAGTHIAVVIGTYGRRGDGVNGVNWKKIMRERRLYHVSWEEYLLILQFVLARKYTLNKAVDHLQNLTSDMKEVTKKMIGEIAKKVLLTSKTVVELDLLRQMKFPSHQLMYDRTIRRLRVDEDFERFKDIQEVVNGNIQGLGEYHAAEAEFKVNTGLIAISILSLFELAYQGAGWPFVGFVSERVHFSWKRPFVTFVQPDVPFESTGQWGWIASIFSALAAIAAVVGLVMVLHRWIKHSLENKKLKKK